MSRLEFSRKVRAAIIKRAEGLCEQCQAALKPREGEVDHILPCALGGEPTVSNGRLLCKTCHKAKTAQDVRRVRKSDRQRDKDSGAIRPKQSIRSAGFARTDKPARIQKPTPPRRPLYQEMPND